jgi:hypothetical protein
MKCPYCSSNEFKFVHKNALGWQYKCFHCDNLFIVGETEPNQQKETDMNSEGRRFNNCIYTAKAVLINDDGKICKVVGTWDDIIADSAAQARDKAIVHFSKELVKENNENFDVLVAPFPFA